MHHQNFDASWFVMAFACVMALTFSVRSPSKSISPSCGGLLHKDWYMGASEGRSWSRLFWLMSLIAAAAICIDGSVVAVRCLITSFIWPCSWGFRSLSPSATLALTVKDFSILVDSFASPKSVGFWSAFRLFHISVGARGLASIGTFSGLGISSRMVFFFVRVPVGEHTCDQVCQVIR